MTISETAVRLITHGPPRTGWVEEAACREAPKSWFFAELQDGIAYPEHVRALCRSCPVILDCLAETLPLETSRDHGMRGDLTPRQRRRLRSAVREFQRAIASR